MRGAVSLFGATETRRALTRRRRLVTVLGLVVAPAGAAAVCAALTPGIAFTDAPLAVLLTMAAAAHLTERQAQWAPLLPFMRRAWRGAAPLLGLLALIVLKAAAVLPGVSFTTLFLAAGAAAVLSALPLGLTRRSALLHPVLRTAIIGSASSATTLDRELRLARVADHVVVGRIAPDAQKDLDDGDAVPVLGALGQLSEVVHRHRLDLLVVTGDVSRVAVFEELAHSWVGHRARVWELAGLCETLFGHVPTAEIDATWFGYVLHPKYRESSETVKRAVDVAGALVAAVALLPVLLVAAWLVRRDGGPALFRQVRVGREGRPFTLLKLRTMSTSSTGEARWSGPSDPRVTRIGALLRRTHLDELPQLLNVLRGEMSLVGPRPEVPEFVERLEQTLPFYGRRHLVKPGLTGWAQVRVGYAGSDLGSAWKLCHDLYYVKHRSLALDLMILGETARMLFIEPHAPQLPVSAWAGHRRAVGDAVAPDVHLSREPA